MRCTDDVQYPGTKYSLQVPLVTRCGTANKVITRIVSFTGYIRQEYRENDSLHTTDYLKIFLNSGIASIWPALESTSVAGMTSYAPCATCQGLLVRPHLSILDKTPAHYTRHAVIATAKGCPLVLEVARVFQQRAQSRSR